MTYRDRILADSASDHDAWLAARATRIGASDAGSFAKASSVESYVRAKLQPSSFKGNEATESGHRWEPLLLDYLAIPRNSYLIGSPVDDGFAATPDGIEQRPDGTLRLAEIKAKHNRIVAGPTPSEIRQMAWQLFVLPEAVAVEFCWGELIQTQTGWELRKGNPKHLTFTRDHPQIVAATGLIVPIAREVLAAMRVALLEGAPF